MTTEKTIPQAAELSAAKRRLLARRLRGSTTSIPAPDVIQPRPAGSRVLLSPEQSGLWLQSAFDPDLPTYNEAVTVRYCGTLDAVTLEASLNLFLGRHEIWRTSFHPEQDEVVQRVEANAHVSLDVFDLRHLAEEKREEESNRIATAQAIVPFNLEKAPLLRASLVLGGAESRLHMVIAHIVFDGFSLRRTFLPELRTIYTALAAGQAPTLPPVAPQYGDYAFWRRQSPLADESLTYWKRQLAGELVPLRLPTDRPRPPALTRRGNMERFTLAGTTVDALRLHGQRAGASLYMMLLASLGALLFRYSGQQDLIVGTVADGRSRSELAGMMGYVLQILPIRTAPRADLPFVEYLTQVRNVVLEGLAMGDTSFARMVELSQAKPDRSHQPIFQTMFAFQPAATEADDTWTVNGTEITTGTAKFDLYMEADEQASRTAIRIFYSTDLFDAPTIRRLIDHWSTLLAGVAADPHCVLGDLPLLTEAEREQMLHTWNETGQPIPETTVHGLVQQQAQREPERRAVTCGTTAWTYAQLIAEAERFAAALQHAGARRNMLIAVMLDRSPALLAGLLGILMTGAAYLPLDPSIPASRLALCLEDAQPDLLLTQRAYAKTGCFETHRILLLENIQSAAPKIFTAPGNGSPSDLAYVLYTSGSTGKPKGVEVEHRSVVNFLRSMQTAPGFRRDDTVVALTTVSFDIAVLELFLPLLVGGCVALALREEAVDPVRLARLIDKSGCTVMQATPATWSALLGSGWKGVRGLRALCGGEVLTRTLADQLLAAGLELWNVYGPTETTVWSTVSRVQRGTGPVPVGLPIANTTAYVLDGRQQPVPVGVAGELYLGGAGVARGYRHAPQLTAEKFVPVACADGARLYRTGDDAVFRQTGVLELLGRRDNQVKIRGHRVELEDVESSFATHPAVAAVAVKAWPDEFGEQRLCAYLVARAGKRLQPAEVRAYLRSRLPAYMMPSNIVLLSTLPLTPNGKVDRRQLSEPVPSEVASDDEGGHARERKAPRSFLERQLYHIWCATLGVPALGIEDSFFSLGVDSLTALRLITRINRTFGTELGLANLLTANTIAALATLIEHNLTPTVQRSLVPLRATGSQRPLFMVHGLGGNILHFTGLAGRLPDSQPVYALQAQVLLTGQPALLRLEAIAAYYVREVRSVQPHGPYRLLGFSFGGAVVAEMAAQLECAGEQVSLLVMLDAHTRAYELQHNIALGTAGVADRIWSRFVRNLDALTWGERIRYVGCKLSTRMVQSLAGVLLALRVDRLPARLKSAREVNLVAFQRYVPKVSTGKVVLFRAKEQEFREGANDQGWGPLFSGGVDIYEFEGDHERLLLDPALTQLSEQLSRLLEIC